MMRTLEERGIEAEKRGKHRGGTEELVLIPHEIPGTIWPKPTRRGRHKGVDYILERTKIQRGEYLGKAKSNPSLANNKGGGGEGERGKEGGWGGLDQSKNQNVRGGGIVGC